MTFLEKFKKEHPGLEITTWRDIPQKYFGCYSKCPKYINYETMTQGKNACRTYTCDGCWNREIPNTELNTEPKMETVKPKNESEMCFVYLTKKQCINLIDLIDATLVKQIRDTKHDIKVEVLHDTTSAYMELKKAIEQ